MIRQLSITVDDFTGLEGRRSSQRLGCACGILHLSPQYEVWMLVCSTTWQPLGAWASGRPCVGFDYLCSAAEAASHLEHSFSSVVHRNRVYLDS